MNNGLIASALIMMATAPAVATVRLVRVIGSDGSACLTMTNLDKDGRRLGGEVTEDDRRRLRGDPLATRNQWQPPAEASEVALAGIDGLVTREHLAARLHSFGCGCPLHARIPHRDRPRSEPRARGTWQSAADPHARAIDVTPYTRQTARERNRASFHRD